MSFWNFHGFYRILVIQVVGIKLELFVFQFSWYQLFLLNLEAFYAAVNRSANKLEAICCSTHSKVVWSEDEMGLLTGYII